MKLSSCIDLVQLAVVECELLFPSEDLGVIKINLIGLCSHVDIACSFQERYNQSNMLQTIVSHAFDHT